MNQLQILPNVTLGKLQVTPVLLYCSETMIWREKDNSRIRVVQTYNIRGLLLGEETEYRMYALESCTWWGKGWMKELTNGFGLKEWKTIGFLKGCMWESV